MELTPEQDKRCDAIVEQALALAPELRHDFVTREAAGDQAVCQAALNILALVATDLPTEFGAYEVIRHIGSGGMGDVYLARDPDIDRLVAVKVLKDWGAPEVTRRRFISEARTLGKIDHPNVVRIFNYFPREKRPYFVMEYIKGESLASAIRNNRSGDFQRRVMIARQIADAARAVHDSGTLHRDIKTENVILTPTGIPKLLDFGIARTKTSNLTDPALRVGTLANLSPEVIEGEPASTASDIYAYGLLLFELFTGVVPFAGNRSELLEGILGEGVSAGALRDARLPRELKELIRHSTAQAPRSRPQNFEEVIRSLDRVPVAAQSARRLTLALIAAGVLLFVVTTALLYRAGVFSAARQANNAPAQIARLQTTPPSSGGQPQQAPRTKESDPAPASPKNAFSPPKSAPASQSKTPPSGSLPIVDPPAVPAVVVLPPVNLPTPSSNPTPPSQLPAQEAHKGDARARENPRPEESPATPAGAPPGPKIEAAPKQDSGTPPDPASNSRKAVVDREQDLRDVLAVLDRFEAAYRNRRVPEIAVLWPTLQGEGLQQLKASLSAAKNVEFQLMSRNVQLLPESPIDARPDKAIVRCSRVARMIMANGQPEGGRSEILVQLERQNGTWKILEIAKLGPH